MSEREAIYWLIIAGLAIFIVLSVAYLCVPTEDTDE